jgi:hypothetical protein
VDRLAARVLWLDRYRRLLALAIAALLAPYLIAQVSDTLGTDWPSMHVMLVSAMVSLIVWWFVEVGLVYVTALWETEHARLIHTRGLPRAVLHRMR